MHGQFYTDTVGPGSKDHLAFPCTVGGRLNQVYCIMTVVEIRRHEYNSTGEGGGGGGGGTWL